MRQRTCRCALLLALTLAAAARASAQDGVVKLFDSSLNEFANRIQPMRMNGHHKATTFVWPFGEVTICDSDYTATVSQLTFATTPAAVTITGRVDATWCGVSVNSPLQTTANVSYSGPQRAILVSVNPTNIQPHVTVGPFNIPLPFHINVAPSLNIPPIPMASGLIFFQGAQGPVSLRVEPLNVSLLRRSGFLELQTDVTVW
jgi:hypothetical protein